MKFLFWINRRLPFPGLPIARIKLKNQTATLRKDGWVVISDGESEDMLPITLCSRSIVLAFEAEFA